MSKVFISYRRDDSAGYAHAIHSQLVHHFSKGQVFMDVDTVEPGVDFVRAIEKAVGECDVLIALIGKRWARGEASGTSRLDDTKDYVRLEVSTALARDIRVIPVLVDGMTMPNEDSLPPPLRPITRRNAIEISNTRFNYDVEQLIAAVRRILNTIEPEPKANEEKERNRAQQEAEKFRLITEAQRKAEEAGLHQQERRQNEEDSRPKAEEESRRRIDRKIPNSWRTYATAAAAVAVVLIIFSLFFWRPKEQETERVAPPPETNANGQNEKPIFTQTVMSAAKVFRDPFKSGGEAPEMIVVPGGSFKMGDVHGGGHKNDVPVHTVTIQKPFAIGRYEVTFGEYDQFAKATNRKLPDDQGWGRGRRPVIKVSWEDANAYAKWLSEQTGKRYRLPTEAEWEYAARAGKETNYWWGNDLIKGIANCNGCGSQWDSKQTAPVGSFKPNAFGLHDTAGNVWEWVEDCRHDEYKGAPTDGGAWLEESGGQCDQRVIRGGSWDSKPEYLRSATRLGTIADDRDNLIGFRLAQDTN